MPPFCKRSSPRRSGLLSLRRSKATNEHKRIKRTEHDVVLQQESNRQLIQQRLNLFRLPVLFIFFILAARLWQLQIIQGAEYALKAEHNKIRTIQLVAPRGTISDRNNIPLVENRPSFDVLLYREAILLYRAKNSGTEGCPLRERTCNRVECRPRLCNPFPPVVGGLQIRRELCPFLQQCKRRVIQAVLQQIGGAGPSDPISQHRKVLALAINPGHMDTAERDSKDGEKDSSSEAFHQDHLARKALPALSRITIPVISRRLYRQSPPGRNSSPV